MASRLVFKNFYNCDAEADLSLAWPDGTYANTNGVTTVDQGGVMTVAPSKNWKKVAGAWEVIELTTEMSCPLEVSEQYATGGLGGANPEWNNIQNKPNTFPPSAHNHDASYSAIGHTHSNYAALIPQEFTFIGGVTAWTNKALALQEFLNTNQRRLTLDLTNATQFRLIMNVTTQGTASSITVVQYSEDGGTNWKGLDNGTANIISTVTLSDLGTGSKVSAWTNLATTAKADRLLRIVGSGGDGAADPAYSNISIQFK